MSNTPANCSINSRQQQKFTFNVFDKNNVLDTSTPATVTSDHPEIATAQMLADGRSFNIIGQAGGSCTVTVTVGDGSAGTSGGTNTVAVACTEAPDLRHIDLSAGFVTDKPL